MLTVNRQSRYRGFLDTNHVFSDALIFALIALLHVGYHQIAAVHESYSEMSNERLIMTRDVHPVKAMIKITAINFSSPTNSAACLTAPLVPMGRNRHTSGIY